MYPTCGISLDWRMRMATTPSSWRLFGRSTRRRYYCAGSFFPPHDPRRRRWARGGTRSGGEAEGIPGRTGVAVRVYSARGTEYPRFGAIGLWSRGPIGGSERAELTTPAAVAVGSRRKEPERKEPERVMRAWLL